MEIVADALDEVFVGLFIQFGHKAAGPGFSGRVEQARLVGNWRAVMGERVQDDAGLPQMIAPRLRVDENSARSTNRGAGSELPEIVRALTQRPGNGTCGR